jgi:hypothetical protein
MKKVIQKIQQEIDNVEKEIEDCKKDRYFVLAGIQRSILIGLQRALQIAKNECDN